MVRKNTEKQVILISTESSISANKCVLSNGVL